MVDEVEPILPAELTEEQIVQSEIELSGIDTESTYYVYKVVDEDFNNLGNYNIMTEEFLEYFGDTYNISAYNKTVAELTNAAKDEDGVVPEGSEPTIPEFPDFILPLFFNIDTNTYFITDIDSDDVRFTKYLDGSVT